MTLRRHENRTGRPRKDRSRRRPALEALEVRQVLSTTFTVTSLADANPPANVTTLRQALLAADADGNTDPAHPDVIQFAVSGAITLETPLPTITGSLAITGPGASGLNVKIDPNLLTVATIFTVGDGASTQVSGLSLGGGGANAIVVGANASLTARNDTFSRIGLGGGDAQIGAVILANQEGATVDVEDSTFDGNFAPAVVDQGAASLTVARSTFSNNSSSGNGGALLIGADSHGQGGGFSVTDSLFVNDFANYSGVQSISTPGPAGRSPIRPSRRTRPTSSAGRSPPGPSAPRPARSR